LTNQGEAWLQERLIGSEHFTSDPEEADLFYIPVGQIMLNTLTNARQP
jgi:hypothetical protein